MSASMLKYLIAADSLCDGENGVSLTALALKAVGALSGRSIEALTDFFEKNVVKKAV